MIVQPQREDRYVNDLFYYIEGKRIDELNSRFFGDIELTDAENDILVWLCEVDNPTYRCILSLFKKIIDNARVK